VPEGRVVDVDAGVVVVAGADDDADEADRLSDEHDEMTTAATTTRTSSRSFDII
jgi:hypothetical protein